MSCYKCDEAQEYKSNSFTGHNQATFVRVGVANVMISGCEEHLLDLITRLRAGNVAIAAEEDEDDE